MRPSRYRGATRHTEARPGRSEGLGLKQRLRARLTDHLREAVGSLGRLTRSPLSNLMTAAVIGIALALPGALHVALKNVQQLTGRWDALNPISLYLKTGVDEKTASDLARELEQRPDIEQVTLIGREEALEEFRRLSGFGEALDTLGENPLPVVLVVHPATNRDMASVRLLHGELATLPQVELAQLDMEWLQRLQAMTHIARRAVLLLAVLFGLAVLLVVGNTIRLDIRNRHEEIELTKLIGATDAFIRRPFLYGGLWYGLSGAFIALVLVTLFVLSLSGPVEHLASLYSSGFGVTGLSWWEAAILLSAGGALGLLGSWLSVSHHLKAIEPR
jgi:cell division transport system permease protein